MNGPIARDLIVIVALALTAALPAGCGGTLMLSPSSSRTWEIVERRAMFDMDCGDLHSRVALGNGAARTNGLGRKYYEFAVRGCGRRAVYRAYFRAFPFGVGYVWSTGAARRPAQQEVDRSHSPEQWTQEVELVDVIRDEVEAAPPTPIDSIATAFDTHLRTTCGLTAATPLYYGRYVREFLAARFGTGAIDLAALRPP